jgi:hypothetical protein
MVAICSSETSIEFKRTTRRYIHQCDNLKFYTSNLLLDFLLSLYMIEDDLKAKVAVTTVSQVLNRFLGLLSGAVYPYIAAWICLGHPIPLISRFTLQT